MGTHAPPGNPDPPAVGRPAAAPPGDPRGNVLATGFGSAAAMWTLGYFTHLPDLSAPSWVVFFLLAGALLGGGYVAGRYGPHGVRGGLYAGWLAGAINLLILGSLWKQLSRDSFAAYALLWAPGSVLATGLVAGIGAWAGAAGRRAGDARIHWPMALGLVACGATLVLLSVGGAVTALEAGLAVPDWPNSFGYNMFLYPLAKMTGGIYFEHAHRLLGSLVGLTTLALMLFLLRTDSRAAVRGLAVGAFVLVCVQGVLGGLRVTGNWTLATAGEELQPNLTLAMIHGVMGQLFFVLLAVLTALLTPAWRGQPRIASGAATERNWGVVAVACVLGQLAVGVALRHLGWGLHLHVTLAVVAVAVAGIFALRVWGRHADVPVVARCGLALFVLLLVQFSLGWGALAAISFEHVSHAADVVQAIVTTLHQTTGALVLAVCVLTLVWHVRLIAPPARAVSPGGESRLAGGVS